MKLQILNIKESNNKFTFLVIVVLINIIYSLLGLIKIELPSIFRYMVNAIAIFYYFRDFSKIQWNSKSIYINLLYFWIILLLLMSIPDFIDNYRNHIKFKQFFSSIFITYLFVFLITFKIDLKFIKSIFNLSYNFLLFYLIITVPFFLYFTKSSANGAEVTGSLLVGGLVILLMTLPYHNIKKQFFIVLAFIVVTIINIILARRNQVLFFSSAMFFAYLISFLSKGVNIRKKTWNLFLFVIISSLFISIVFFIFTNPFDFFIQRVATGMESREGVIELFTDDFNSHKLDWYLGRGVFGEFEGGVILATDYKTGLRDGIENGYYFSILKGGWIYLGLLILISLKAMYNGFFKSKNLLVKGMASIILIYFIDMIGFGIPEVSLKYAMVFISIAGCNLKWLRECSNEYLTKQIGLN